MKFDQYLIVSDMDGTFLGEGSSLVERNLEAIKYFKENGGIFTIASGRDYRVFDPIFPNAHEYLSGPAILSNGSYLFNCQTKEIIEEQYLDKDEFLSILKEFEKEFPNVGYRISCEKGFLCPKLTNFLKSKTTKFASLIVEESLEDNMDIQWHKCVFVAEPETIVKIGEYFKDLNSQLIAGTTSYVTLFELVPKKASKGQKLERLKEFYPGRQTICVGDFTNDMDMLLAADIAACPENALDEIKRICKIHLCRNTEGCIADLIYKLDSSTK